MKCIINFRISVDIHFLYDFIIFITYCFFYLMSVPVKKIFFEEQDINEFSSSFGIINVILRK